MNELRHLNISAAHWARVGWAVKARRRAQVMAAVKAAEAAHIARYGWGHELHNRGNANVRTGAFNMPKEFAA